LQILVICKIIYVMGIWHLELLVSCFVVKLLIPKEWNNTMDLTQIKRWRSTYNYIAISACRAASSSSSALLLWADGLVDCWAVGTRTGAVDGAVVVGASSSASNSSPSRSASSASSSSYSKQKRLSENTHVCP
jgi:hypothetical protein